MRFDDFRAVFGTSNKRLVLILHDRVVFFHHGEHPLLGILRFHGLTMIP